MLPDGTVAWARLVGGSGGYSHTVYDRYTLSGENLGSLSTVGIGADHHDLQQLGNGNFLLMAYVPRHTVDLTPLNGPANATVLDAEIQEITPEGDLVWSWNSKDHIALEETSHWGLANTQTTLDGQPAYDIVHINSLEQHGDLVVFSARHLDAVYAIRRSDGGVEWKLGGTTRLESLSFAEDPLGSTSFDGPHDARILEDGTLTLHDNRTQQQIQPRALRYSLDLDGRSATLLEDVRDPRIATSGCCGNARRLPGGHWVMSWGGHGTITELTSAGEPILTLLLTSGFSYRVQPISSGLLDRAELAAGMNAEHPR
jgi:hypothetical protein